MRKNDFNRLIESIKEAGEIKAGKKKPSRTFFYETPNRQLCFTSTSWFNYTLSLKLNISSNRQ